MTLKINFSVKKSNCVYALLLSLSSTMLTFRSFLPSLWFCLLRFLLKKDNLKVVLQYCKAVIVTSNSKGKKIKIYLIDIVN